MRTALNVTATRMASDGLIINRLYGNYENAHKASTNHSQRDKEQGWMPNVAGESKIIEGSGNDSRNQGAEKRRKQQRREVDPTNGHFHG